MADISLIQDVCFDDPDDGGDTSDSGDCDTSGYQQDEEPLTACAKLQKYAQSEEINYRQVVPSILLEIFRDGTADSITNDLPALLDVIARIADDYENSIRMDLVQHIPHLAAACVEYSQRIPALSTVVVDNLLPLVVNYLSDTDYQVRKSTHATLLTLMEQCLVPRQAIEAQVCPVVLCNTLVDDLPDHLTDAVVIVDSIRGSAVYCCTHQLIVKCVYFIISQPALMSAKLMGKMVPLLGRDITERLFLKRFSELCSNSLFHIRKMCACSFGEFCAVVGRTAYENILLPCFIALCADHTWAVRKACAEVVMTVSCACTPQLRRHVLAPAFAQLLQDQSRWVRMSAFQTLGPFISTFADPSIIGLAYNQLGELVLINPAGTEFRINSPAFTDANLKAAADFKQLMCQSQAQMIKKSLVDQMIEDEIDENKMQQNQFQIDENKTDHSLDNVHTADETDIETSNGELDSINSNSTAQTTNIEDLRATRDNNNFDIVDCFKNIVIEDSGDAAKKDEDLGQYNIYQYWYISPDLPLDPSIVDQCGSPKKCLQNDDSFINRLDDIHFNNSWSVDKTKLLKLEESMLLEKSLPSSVLEPSPSQQIVPHILIEQFISMTNPDLAYTDNDMPYHCAFSLPAVALTLGKENWALLKQTCEILSTNMQYKIRKIVASSLHELALILGQEMAAKFLSPIFDGFIKDLDEVRIGVLKHLAHFLKLIGPHKRNEYLPRLAEFLQTDNESNWRFREELANQLLIAVPLFSPADAARHIALLAKELLCDKVFAVRQIALLLVTELVRHVSGEPNLTSWLLIKLAEEFAHSKRWVRRQAFALLCSSLIAKNALPPDQFATVVMPHLLDLSWDPVPNVRLAVSRTISRDIIVHEYFSDVNNEQHEPLHMVLRRLQADKDRDVRQYAVLPVH